VTLSTKVAIIGAGPAGTLLSHALHRAGIESIVVERSSREHVLGRIRAGVLEWGTVEFLREMGLGGRMDTEGHVHDGTGIVWGGREVLTIDIRKHASSQFMSYGQTMVQEDLYLAADQRCAQIHFEAGDVALHDITGDRPAITFVSNGTSERIEADFIVGCDGFHGAARRAMPDSVLRTYEKEYPFGWLGILSETPPLDDLIYANHERGFALASQRNPMLSRYYVQCPLTDSIEDWSDDRFWTELTTRLGPSVGPRVVTGPSIEKSIAPLRSFVAEPMRHGSLFLAGDAAHIVPPTGAKGLNLAVSDVFYLSRAMAAHYASGDDRYLDGYSEMALRRVWGAVRFSWWLTTLLHRFPDQTDFDQRAQEAELDYLAASTHAQAAMAEQYAGLPFES
jgi:p-hydroxybenzoate 3-monooxygenase